MGIKNTLRATGALVSVHKDNLKQEFALARELANQETVITDRVKEQKRRDAEVIKWDEKVTALREDLAQAEAFLAAAKEEADNVETLPVPVS